MNVKVHPLTGGNAAARLGGDNDGSQAYTAKPSLATRARYAEGYKLSVTLLTHKLIALLFER
ncbi:hypothetical protein [Paenibacillus sp. LHD-38]|uniref:hypothetical protein n=1 Tax=Paenibacillus sp. LHD-38 TaxID=3072143 RepID=UPI00280F6904|nr:hypothetical protein [Paenibacillus sp. LHD-38]MDQ8739348.1 hypothetical protein [Paenibacillus sp. LHD-38]